MSIITATLKDIEKKELMGLYEYKYALVELFIALADGEKTAADKEITTKIISDIIKASTDFENKWLEIAKSNKWDLLHYTNWNLDFASNKVTLEVCDC